MGIPRPGQAPLYEAMRGDKSLRRSRGGGRWIAARFATICAALGFVRHALAPALARIPAALGFVWHFASLVARAPET